MADGHNTLHPSGPIGAAMERRLSELERRAAAFERELATMRRALRHSGGQVLSLPDPDNTVEPSAGDEVRHG